MASNESATLEAAVQALAALPSLLKPYTVTGTKLRLPNSLADKLPNLRELETQLSSVHYEGVNYSEDEPAPDHGAMDRARDDAQQAVYRIRNLVAAAIVCNDDDDTRISAVLDCAAKQLDALGVALDSVNFGVQQ